MIDEHQPPDTRLASHGRGPAEMAAWLASGPEGDRHREAYSRVVAIAELVENEGGRAYMVGGSVRDELLGRMPKDFDMEVHGLPLDAVRRILETHATASGRPVELVGQSFGIFQTTVNGSTIEIGLPRRDSKTGPRHTDFAVAVDPGMGVTEAGRRRDFTIGAIYKNILTGELDDPFYGVQDLQQRLLRMVDARTFADDSLRVLRAMQFVGRFGLSVDPETQDALKSMVAELAHLPPERLREEWTKLFLESPRPSLGLEVGAAIGYFERWYPDIAKLRDTPQDPEHHPEGDVWTHTMLVVDAAAELIRRENLSDDERLVRMLAIFTHDFGKATTTERAADGRVHAYGHEEAGVEPTRVFLTSQGFPESVTRRVVPLIRAHVRPRLLYRDEQRGQRVSPGAFRRLAHDVHPATLRQLADVSATDALGRGTGEPRGDAARGNIRGWLLQRGEEFGVAHGKPAPVVAGRDFMDLGWRPGPHIGRMMQLCERLAEHNVTRDHLLEVLRAASGPEEAEQELERRLTAAS